MQMDVLIIMMLLLLQVLFLFEINHLTIKKLTVHLIDSGPFVGLRSISLMDIHRVMLDFALSLMLWVSIHLNSCVRTPCGGVAVIWIFCERGQYGLAFLSRFIGRKLLKHY